LTLLAGLVSNPASQTVSWLDLACGEGQILTGVQKGFAEAERRKIAYTGFDRMDAYLRGTEKIASASGLQAHHMEVGNLSALSEMLPGKAYDFITLINAVHEIDPKQLAAVLVDSLLRLTQHGILYAYDMESIEPAELGAIPWTAGEFQSIAISMFEAVGAGAYRPAVQRWAHKSRDGWSLTVHREHVSAQDLSRLRAAAEAATSHKIGELLHVKLLRCKAALEHLTTYGPETADEQAAEQNLLHEFWAVSRALEAR
jgi:hypothetical protein